VSISRIPLFCYAATCSGSFSGGVWQSRCILISMLRDAGKCQGGFCVIGRSG
jgi:hypothetical protein